MSASADRSNQAYLSLQRDIQEIQHFNDLYAKTEYVGYDAFNRQFKDISGIDENSTFQKITGFFSSSISYILPKSITETFSTLNERAWRVLLGVNSGEILTGLETIASDIETQLKILNSSQLKAEDKEALSQAIQQLEASLAELSSFNKSRSESTTVIAQLWNTLKPGDTERIATILQRTNDLQNRFFAIQSTLKADQSISTVHSLDSFIRTFETLPPYVREMIYFAAIDASPQEVESSYQDESLYKNVARKITEYKINPERRAYYDDLVDYLKNLDSLQLERVIKEAAYLLPQQSESESIQEPFKPKVTFDSELKNKRNIPNIELEILYLQALEKASSDVKIGNYETDLYKRLSVNSSEHRDKIDYYRTVMEGLSEKQADLIVKESFSELKVRQMQAKNII